MRTLYDNAHHDVAINSILISPLYMQVFYSMDKLQYCYNNCYYISIYMYKTYQVQVIRKSCLLIFDICRIWKCHESDRQLQRFRGQFFYTTQTRGTNEGGRRAVKSSPNSMQRKRQDNHLFNKKIVTYLTDICIEKRIP